MTEAAEIVKQIIECFKRGGKLLICGNGGSASMAQHMAAEFVCSFEKVRLPLPAIALTTDSSILTAWSNDRPTGFTEVFSRQVQALGKVEDILITLSTSGNSLNCLNAGWKAREMGIEHISFPIIGKNTAEIQEYQLHLMHEVVREVEGEMFK